jgi:hypothetical protein
LRPIEKSANLVQFFIVIAGGDAWRDRGEQHT